MITLLDIKELYNNSHYNQTSLTKLKKKVK